MHSTRALRRESPVLIEIVDMVGPYLQKAPVIHPTAFVADNADLYGDVTVGESSGIFFHCSARGDINSISIGAFANIQDHCILHVSDDFGVVIEDWVTVGHGAVVHGATVKKGALIGIRSVVMDGAVIGEEAMVAAGAVVVPGTVVPARSLAVGIPAKVVRELRQEEISDTYRRAKRYIEQLAPWYRSLQR